MRLHVFSDLHVDVRPGPLPEPQPAVDAIIVAGDTCEGIGNGMAVLRRQFPAPVPIVMVAGNHEFCNHALAGERAAAPGLARTHGITFLDDAVAVIDGVRFIGATLWTDFLLDGPGTQATAMQAASRYMLDYRAIALDRPGGPRFTPAHSLRLHQASRAFLERTLAEPHAGPTVVLTHHAPHPGSVAPRFHGDPVTPAFVSDLSDLIAARGPVLWVHGHTHTSFDYKVAHTRVLCNPKGYGRENRAFDLALIIET